MPGVLIKDLGSQDYASTWSAMKQFTDTRTPDSTDEFWLVEHPPVFTFGQAGKPEHLLNPHDIPVVKSDRGGQITYHGPGQIVLYTLLDLRRLGIGARALVNGLENSIIDTLSNVEIKAFSKKEAPGVYIAKADLPAAQVSSMRSNDAKIAALGLRVRKGCSYHGLSLNVDMNLEPFSYINPCGFQDQAVCQIKDFISTVEIDEVKQRLYLSLCKHLGLTPADDHHD